MKPNELRIGNWVMQEYENGETEPLQIASIIWQNDNMDGLKGIELTAEIFEKTSLIKNGVSFCAPENVRMKSAKDEGKNYCSFFFNKRLNKWMDTQTRITLDYLHELQNYYFIMTGEELEINL